MAWLKKLLQVLLLLAIILFCIAVGTPIGVMIAYWNDLPSLGPLEYETQSWHYPTKIYSDICRISREMSLNNLLERLERLGYQQVSGDPTDEGQFYLKNPSASVRNEMRLYLRELSYPRLSIAPRLIAIQTERGKISEMENDDGTPLTEFILEPEMIAEFYGSEGTDRELVGLSRIPKHLVNAFIAIEDKRFYKHWGFDTYRILGVLYLNIKHRRIVQGASTITQQLARDLFLTKRQLWSRKIKEALLAIKIERKYTKDEILERYLNRVNLGRCGPREIYGVREAARYYFGKEVWNLNLQECATLAAIPKDQMRYSPIRNPENSISRRQIVLRQMLKLSFITQAEYEEASASSLGTASSTEQLSDEYAASYFLEYIRSQLVNKYQYEPSAIHRQGLEVYTTLDVSMQLAANSAVQMRLGILDEQLRFPRYEENRARWLAGERGQGVRNPVKYLQAAMVSIEPSTGYVKTMVGGRDWYVTQFNRAVQSLRQPGSAFKPFIYCTGLANNLITPTTIIVDEPWSIRDPSEPGGFWNPANFYKEFYGRVTVRKMCVRSINVATARLLYEKIGPERVVEMARKLGIKTPMAPVPSLALGASDVRLLEITSAYGVFANEGIRAEPISIKYVLDRYGKILEENAPQIERVLDKNVAFQITYLMQGVVDNAQGTGRNLRNIYGFDRPVAAKTGTTNDETDTWFIGFLPGFVTGVWVGFDDYGKSVRRTGAGAALPVWAHFMSSAVDGPVEDFTVPEGIVFREVDADTGLPASRGSTNAIREAFLRGTEPAGDLSADAGGGERTQRLSAKSPQS